MTSVEFSRDLALLHQNHGRFAIAELRISRHAERNHADGSIASAFRPLTSLLRILAKLRRAAHQPTTLPRKRLNVVGNLHAGLHLGVLHMFYSGLRPDRESSPESRAFRKSWLDRLAQFCLRAVLVAVVATIASFSDASAQERRWVKHAALQSCSSPTPSNACQYLATHDEFTVVGHVSGLFADWYKIRSPKYGEGYAPKQDVDELSQFEDPKLTAERDLRGQIAAREKAKKAAEVAAADCARRGQPKIGMTSAELIETCWRHPARVYKRTTAAGVQESYVYGGGHIVKVSHGKVSEIIEAR